MRAKFSSVKSPVYAAPGEHTDHVDLAWVEEKFRRRTACILTDREQEDVLDLLKNGLDIQMQDIVGRINHP